METRRLGKSDLRITKVGVGTAPIGSTPEWKIYWGPQDEKAAITTIQTAIDIGVNWIDTAPFYAGEEQNRLLGKRSKDTATRSISSQNAELFQTVRVDGSII